MQKIPVKLAAPGMTLAKAVVREDGITLVGEGVELSESLIARFEQSGISTITVKGHPVLLDGLPGSTDYGKRAERLDQLFRKHTDNTFMMTLKKVLSQYFRLKAAAIAAAAAEAAAIEAAEAAAAAAAEEAEANGEAPAEGAVAAGAKKNGAQQGKNGFGSLLSRKVKP
ncbi:MAG: hypothetical protein ACK5JO_00595 [Halodesulfovibrio sp.]